MTDHLPRITCPAEMNDHVRKIFNGEYDLQYFRRRPIIVDIGANIGAFALWASRRWPDSILHCYEPVPENFAYLRHNMQSLAPERVYLYNFAIGDPTRTTMFLGHNNCGEASFYRLGEQSDKTVEVVTRDASELPQAHILKLDAEGSEVEILERHSAINYDVVMVEYHSENRRRRIDQILTDYILIGGYIANPHRGVFKYMHKRIPLTLVDNTARQPVS